MVASWRDGLSAAWKHLQKESVISSSFLGRVAWAGRIALGTLVCTILTQAHTARAAILPALPYFSVIISIFAVDENLGKTIQNAYYCVVGSLIPGLICPLIKILFGTTYAATYVAMGVLSYLLAYLEVGPLANSLCKKLALAVAPVNFISFNQSKGLATIFPLELVASVAVGALCGICALLVPFPKLAIREAKLRATAGATCTAAAFSALLESYVAETDERTSYMRVQAEILLKVGRKNLDELKRCHLDLWWEPNLHRTHNKAVIAAFIKVLEELMALCQAMHSAVEQWEVMHPLVAPLKQRMQTPVRLLGNCMARALQHGAHLASSVSPAGKECSGATCVDPEEVRQVMERLERELLKAREYAFYREGLHRLYMGELEEQDPLLPAQHHGGWWDAAAQGDYEALKLQNENASHVSSSAQRPQPRKRSFQGKDRAQKPEKVGGESLGAGSRGSAEGGEPPGGGSRESGSGSSRAAESSNLIPYFLISVYFLFNMDRYARTVLDAARVPGFLVSQVAPSPAAADLEQSRQSSAARDDTDADVEDPSPGVQRREERASARAAADGMPSSAKKASSGSCIHSAHMVMRRRLVKLLAAQKHKEALKRMLAIVGAGLIAKQLTGSGLWAALTAGFVGGAHVGGTFAAGIGRLQGTVAGCVAGYLIIHVSKEKPLWLTGGLTLWSFASGYVRSGPHSAYAGLVACFMCASVALGFKHTTSLQTFAFNRINETAIAVIAVVLVDSLLWPQLSSILLRSEALNNLRVAKESLQQLEHAYLDDPSLAERHKAMADVAVAERQMTASCALQNTLLAEAQQEPQLWHGPFPAAPFKALITSQENVHSLIQVIRRTLFTASDAFEEQVQELVRPLRGPLGDLRAALLDSFLEIIADLDKKGRQVGGPLGAYQLEMGLKVLRPKGRLKEQQKEVDEGKEEDKEKEEEARVQEPSKRSGRMELSSLSNADMAAAALEAAARLQGNHSTDWGGPNSAIQDADVSRVGRDWTRGSESWGSELNEITVDRQMASSPEGEHMAMHGPAQESFEERERRQLDDDVVETLRARRRAAHLEFDSKYELVLARVVAWRIIHPDAPVLSTNAAMPFGAFVYATMRLSFEVERLETAVRELLQADHPLDVATLLEERILEGEKPLHLRQLPGRSFKRKS